MILMRYFHRNEVEQSDSEVLFTQIQGYVKHLELIHGFFESLVYDEEFKMEEFSDKFIFE